MEIELIKYKDDLTKVNPETDLKEGNIIQLRKGTEGNYFFEFYKVTENLELAFVRGIDEDEKVRLDQVTQPLIDKLLIGYSKNQIDSIQAQLQLNIDESVVKANSELIEVTSVALPQTAANPNLPSKGQAWLVGGTGGTTFTQTGGGPPISVPDGSMKIGYYDKTTNLWTEGMAVKLPTIQGKDIFDPQGTGVANERATASYIQPARDLAKVTISPNKFDRLTATIEVGTLFFNSTTQMPSLSSSTANFRARFPKTLLIPGKTYSIKKVTRVQIDTHLPAIFFNAANSPIGYVPRIATAYSYTFTVPVDAEYTYLHIGYLLDAASYPLRDNPVVNEVMLVEGDVVMDFIPFGEETSVVNTTKIDGYDKVTALIKDQVLVEVPEKNLYDQAKLLNLVNKTRYSPQNKNIVSTGSTRYIQSGFVRGLKEDTWYVATQSSGKTLPAGYTYTGGYFAAEEAAIAFSDIAFSATVDGNGMKFKTPKGQADGWGIRFNLILVDATNPMAVIGDYQIQEGEQGDQVEPYKLIKVFNPDYVQGQKTVGGASELAKFTSFDTLSYSNLSDKILYFYILCMLMNKDVVVGGTGTSLYARTTLHCSPHPLAKERPPLMNSLNIASHIWDALNIPGQFYRRFDYVEGTNKYFTEVGGFSDRTDDPIWDDFECREGITRFATGEASISFVIPVNAWQFNFIYRSDSAGTQSGAIAIEGGPGKVEVWNGSAWVEGDGFILNQRETPVSTMDITIKDPITGLPKTFNGYQTKGNTTYQRRLKMRCKSGTFDSRNQTKKVTISSTVGRLSYWGVEWSIREFMVTYINGARGSHGSGITGNSTDLSRYQDNELWGFNLDFMITEDPIYNAGAGGKLPVGRPFSYYADVTENFFFADNQISLKSRCETLGHTFPKMIMFNVSIMNSVQSGSILENGELEFYPTLEGKMITSLDAQMSSYLHVKQNHPEHIYINGVSDFVEACKKVYGSLYVGSAGSGVTGSTFTKDGTHPNDLGSKRMARLILPLLDRKL